jgi:hypothetical protein
MQSASHDIAVSVGLAPEEIGAWQELEDRVVRGLEVALKHFGVELHIPPQLACPIPALKQ